MKQKTEYRDPGKETLWLPFYCQKHSADFACTPQQNRDLLEIVAFLTWCSSGSPGGSPSRRESVWNNLVCTGCLRGSKEVVVGLG